MKCNLYKQLFEAAILGLKAILDAGGRRQAISGEVPNCVGQSGHLKLSLLHLGGDIFGPERRVLLKATTSKRVARILNDIRGVVRVGEVAWVGGDGKART